MQIEVPSKEKLNRWRKQNEKIKQFRAAEEDKDIVAALNHQPIEPEMRHKEFPKLAQKRIEKRTKHDATVKQFEVPGRQPFPSPR